jgi:hypothetical protein
MIRRDRTSRRPRRAIIGQSGPPGGGLHCATNDRDHDSKGRRPVARSMNRPTDHPGAEQVGRASCGVRPRRTGAPCTSSTRSRSRERRCPNRSPSPVPPARKKSSFKTTACCRRRTRFFSGSRMLSAIHPLRSKASGPLPLERVPQRACPTARQRPCRARPGSPRLAGYVRDDQLGQRQERDPGSRPHSAQVERHAMINRYRRPARTWTELGLGELVALDGGLPELAAITPQGQWVRGADRS